MPRASRPRKDHGEDREGGEAHLPFEADPHGDRQQGQPTQQSLARPDDQLLRWQGQSFILFYFFMLRSNMSTVLIVVVEWVASKVA